MEALWSLEDKWKLSTQKAIALFACTSFFVISICVAIMLIKRKKSRRRGSVHQEPCKDTLAGIAWAEPPAEPGRCSVMKALIGSVRWSRRRSQWQESLRASQREAPTPLLVKRDLGGADVGWQSHNSTSAVWQRPILMGEKCELPRFSGLILYDQKGMPLHDQCEEGTMHKQVTWKKCTSSLYDKMMCTWISSHHITPQKKKKKFKEIFHRFPSLYFETKGIQKLQIFEIFLFE